ARRDSVLYSGHRGGGRSIHDVHGPFKRCVDPPLPAGDCRARRQRQFEIERLPISVEHHMQPERDLPLARSHRQGKAMRRVTPVRPAELDAVPVDFGAAQQLVEAQPEAFLITRTQQPEALGNEFSHKLMEVPVSVEEAPIEPADLVILAIGIAVAPLSAPHFVAHLEHRRTNRCEQDYNQVFYLAASQLLDGSVPEGIVAGGPLDPAVPRQVGPGAVPVPFAIRLVVLFVIRNQIVQRETVVTGYEIDALLRFAFLVPENVRTAERPLRQQPYRPTVAFDKAAYVVPEAAIPFLPIIAEEAPHLIETGSVPRLGDLFDAGEDGIRVDIPENRGAFERAAGFVPGQDRGEVEAEPIDVHMGDPVPCAVENHAAHDRLVGVQRVSGSTVIRVLSAVFFEDVIDFVCEAPEAERGPFAIPLRGMVVDNIEYHLDTGAVERLDEIAELVDGTERVLS